jgi:hypothetical protein
MTIHPWKQAHRGTKATLALKTKGRHEHPERKARNLPLRAKQHAQFRWKKYMYDYFPD